MSKIVNISIFLMFVLLALSLHSLAAHIEDQLQNPTPTQASQQNEDKNIVTEKDLGWKSTINHRENGKEDNSSKEESIISNPLTDASEKQIKEKLSSNKEKIDIGEKYLGNQKQNIDKERSEINKQLDDLDKKSNEISAYQDNQKKDSEQEIIRLAHIYEQMPPRDAAAVFNVLDIRVLVPVAQHMNPRKISAVIGGMLPDRANILTQYLIGARKLHSDIH
ncbi:hypothetical protein PT283_01685 [Acetobacteraceae bacterium ESL0697]|nr:hypothetical protein [Acetobacteraceae bacterium ESL0697]